MPQITQRFDLNLEAITKLNDTERRNRDFPKAGKVLQEGLLAKGYEVLISNELQAGVPLSVLVTGEFGKDIKGDFYGLAEDLNLLYRSGPYYTKSELLF